MSPQPRYARATAASAARSSPKSPKVQEDATTPKKLKRPSTLPSPKFRAEYHDSGPFTLKPENPKKACRLATLPPEIRLLIFEHVLRVCPTVYIPQHGARVACRGKQLWPALLRVSRLVRQEAAYVFYMQTTFICAIHDLSFKAIKYWVELLPAAHRTFLARNTNLRLDLRIEMREWVRASLAQSWIATERFGNMYSIRREKHRLHFISFCKLADWFLWCGKPANVKMKWNYAVEITAWSWSGWPSRAALIQQFLDVCLLPFSFPCVHQAWVRERRQSEMKKEALNMLDGLDGIFQGSSRAEKATWEGEWNRKVEILRRFLGKW
ncbi:hypothetical protein BU26DRAFT_518955 [Trematosphaeria pertusa]|uniref:F-box domain-containing protein n=1 Tax=Trematosphaeria pertusa TaxID=390896 RepID=A0A6A6IEX2_9PLEO|nr:uncharacterized protein BU26DRAFT_518955 [Trematosphaeria pertusa]KAF2248739.1 hypothetical protein BU26DRAFT_518955 [Trematosphaeria pertusa]